MAVIETTRNDLAPVYQAKPDMRFATTFLSIKYRDYAVNGESLVDKATGELFIKRPEDGRVVSFFQNKKYMHDLMLELRIMLNNNAEFRYPEEDKINAGYLTTDYDVMSIFDNQDINILEQDFTIPNTEGVSYSHMEFPISGDTNGFFIRLTTRDSDKAIVEWLTSQYNSLFRDYKGADPVYRAEAEKFGTVPKWEDSNATITYDVLITFNGETEVYTFEDTVRINEESCILIPTSEVSPENLSTADSVMIRIQSVRYDKIRFLMTHKLGLGDAFQIGFDKFVYPDNAIRIRYINICSFVDSYGDISLLGNEFIVALMDVPYVHRYMMKMSKLTTDNNFILSTTRPNKEIWTANGVWAERIREVFQNGKVVELDCETDIPQLEMYFAKDMGIEYVNISKIPNDKDIYGEEVDASL